MPSAWLAPHIHLALCGQDAVALDVLADAYHLLPDLGSDLRLEPFGKIVAPSAVLAELGQLGWTGSGPDLLRRPPSPLPVSSIGGGGVSNGRDALLVLRSFRRARNIGPGCRPLRDLLSGPIATGEPSEARVAQITSTFQRLVPIVPDQGACLWRAWVLRDMLHSAHQDARWVFGVRLRPFAAHCWLQVEDGVLDDDPDRIASYRPILTV